jgi:hypothetical protein
MAHHTAPDRVLHSIRQAMSEQSTIDDEVETRANDSVGA